MKAFKMPKKISSLVTAVLVVAVCAYISAFHFQMVLIQGDSMYPTYRNFEFAVLNKHETKPKRGDVIAFRLPGKKGALVKRVIGIPGDVLHASDGRLAVNGLIHPDYVDLKDYGILNRGVELSENEYFVLGDNTEESRDSRYEEIGVVCGFQIYGTVVPKRAKKLEKPERFR